MNSHLDGLLDQVSQIWQQYERLVKEFSDCAGPKSALALWICVHVRRPLLHLQSTLLRIFVLFLGLLICIIILFIGWSFGSFGRSLCICLCCFVGCRSSLDCLRPSLSSCSNSSGFELACGVILWAFLLFISLVSIGFLVVTAFSLVIFLALLTLIFRVFTLTFDQIAIGLSLAQDGFFLSSGSLLAKLHFLAQTLWIGSLWFPGASHLLRRSWLLWVLRILLLVLLECFVFLCFWFRSRIRL